MVKWLPALSCTCRPAPPFPESHEAAIARYRDELTWVMDGGLLQGNVLVVTHGEVRCNHASKRLTSTACAETIHDHAAGTPSRTSGDANGD